MQKSYVAKTTINFLDYEFYIRPGDILVHDTSNNNRLTVYRQGQIVKVAKQDPIGIAAFMKNRFIEEVSAPSPAAPVPEAPPAPKKVAKEEPTATPAPAPEPVETKPEVKAEPKAEQKKHQQSYKATKKQEDGKEETPEVQV